MSSAIKSFDKLLTKTDFTLARSCPTKLYYRKMGYHSTLDSNDYVEFLKEGGHIVGEMARVIHPEGTYIGIENGIEQGVARTLEELKKEVVTLFEAVFYNNGALVVCDILEKKPSGINLIEVKSKSFDSNEENQIIGKRGGVDSAWLSYIEDLAFQVQVVSSCLNGSKITPYLLLPDKAKTTKIDELASKFEIERVKYESGDILRVRFLGDKQELINNHFLTRINANDACSLVKEEVASSALEFLNSLSPDVKKIKTPISKNCKDCEFKHEDTTKSGYYKCWKELADVKPHIFELYFGGSIKVNNSCLIDELIAEKKVSLFDIPVDAIKGKRGERQAIQIEYTKNKQEWFNPGFKPILEKYSYPLHFIDFETSTSAIPYHKSMRPYEQIAFQWSCHTISEPNGVPVHSEWINLKESFPSFEFAESLKDVISDKGTVFMWADHENQVLKKIAGQISDYKYSNPELIDWINSMTRSKESEGRLVDMNLLCLDNYFHPQMQGKTSIKYVLPAIWNNNSYLWELPFLSPYIVRDEKGNIMSPYNSLPDIEIEGVKQIVKEGTAAMTAYQDMMYGLSRNNQSVKDKWSKLLRQYCELDTLAMVVIWIHWRGRFGIGW